MTWNEFKNYIDENITERQKLLDIRYIDFGIDLGRKPEDLKTEDIEIFNISNGLCINHSQDLKGRRI
jgi:hypothetical protein